MITVYFDGVNFSKRTFNAMKADIVVIGNREILNIKDIADYSIAQFDMNCVIGWSDDLYDTTDDEESEDEE